MQKILASILTLICLLLTGCNTKPPANPGTDGVQSAPPSSELDLKDTIIDHGSGQFMEFPSRIVYDASGIRYYSKVDGKDYAYCFDPLCEHSDGYCLANFGNLEMWNWEFMCTFFINNRFYTTNDKGNIISCAFDGTDMKLEYDSGFEIGVDNPYTEWALNSTACGPYIYIELRADENGNPHVLRFNTETKEMEDLTEKTGNFMYPDFFYNGEIYGRDRNRLWVKADMDLVSLEPIEEVPRSDFHYGSRFFGYERDGGGNRCGVKIHDMKTGESTVIPNSVFGASEGIEIVYVDENYIYYFHKKWEIYGYVTDSKTGERKPRYRENDGKLYRANHDGTNIVCMYDDPGYEFSKITSLNGIAVIFDGKILINGCYKGEIDGVAEIWGQGLRAGTVREDGTIDKLEYVELLS